MGPWATFSWRTQAPGWRLWLATAIIAAGAFASLARALQEPSTGWRFGTGPDGHVVAQPVREGLPALDQVTALSSRNQPSGPQAGTTSVALGALHVIESAGIHNAYTDHNQFFEDHRRIWAVLHGHDVVIHHAGGQTRADVQPRGLDELGLRFWFPWAVGLLSLSVGLALWAYRPRDLAARCFLASSAGYAFGMLCTAAWGSRLLTQSPDFWPQLHVASHAATFAVGGALCILLWNRPNRLGGPWLPWAVVGVSAFSVMADGFQWVSTISQAFRLPVVLINALLGVLFFAQWRASRDDPARRAQLKWFGLLLLMGLSTVFVAYAVGATGRVVDIPQNYGLASVALLFLGLVPLVTRIGLFQLEAWWPRAWLWFVGGLMVIALDLVLLVALDLSAESALAVALALAGWLYFPLRQLAWRWLSHGALPDTREVLPQVLEIVAGGSADDAVQARRWRALWDSLFQPSDIEPAPPGLDAGIHDDGQRMVVQAAGLPALALGLPGRGSRLFSPADARRASEICQLVHQGLASHQAWEQGARAERQRIASDLHDDLGARLLSIAHTSESPRVADLAREALNDMRLAVRGLTVPAVDLDDAMARWRAEWVGRLAEAGVQVDWQGGDPPALRLGARLDVQLTRVLREAANNILRHSAATHCQVHFDWSDDALALTIVDGTKAADMATQAMTTAGEAARPAMITAGRGLAFMSRRIEGLGGRFAAHATADGFRLDIWLPLR